MSSEDHAADAPLDATPLSDEEIEDCRRYAEGRMVAPDHWHVSEIELCRRNLRWLATIDALRAELHELMDGPLRPRKDSNRRLRAKLRAQRSGARRGIEQLRQQGEIILSLRAEVERLTRERDRLRLRERSSVRLAGEVSRLVLPEQRISSRHPAADALLDWANERGLSLPLRDEEDVTHEQQ